MKQIDGHEAVFGKDRVRAEINEQIEEFLRGGGQIEVVTVNSPAGDTRSGKIWEFVDDNLV